MSLGEPIPQSKPIDAHTHLTGEHAFTGPICEPGIYLANALRTGIGGVIAMSVPSPILHQPDGSSLFPAAWIPKPGVPASQLETRDFDYQSVTTDPSGHQEFGPAQKNPYVKGNLELIRACYQLNSREAGLTAFPAVLHHPVLDDVDTTLEQLSYPGVVALKIHTSTTISEPQQIHPAIIRELIAQRKPIIIHTDMLREGVEPANPLDAIHKILDPMKWAEWAKANPDLRILFAHGMKLHTEALKILLDFCPNAAVGISPGLLINWAPGLDKMHHDPEVDFETDLLAKFKDHPSQIMFDVDYAWNRIPPYPANRAQFNDQAGQDWESIERILQKMHKLGYSQDAVNAFFYGNASRLFNLDWS